MGMYIVKKLSPLKKRLLKKYRLKQYTKKAHGIRQSVIERTGSEVVTKKVKDEIKEYSNDVFGTPSLWPWLAVYTEIKGEFIPGWLPNDYFQITLLDDWNIKRFSEVSDMKTFYHMYFDDFAVKPLALKVSGIYYDQDWNIISMDKLIDRIRAEAQEVVVKKDGGFAGRDIRFLKTNDLGINELEKDKDNFVIQPVVKQHPVLSKFHKHSLNTLRIATFLESDGSVSFKFVLCRFGTGGNRLDNTNAGGRYCFLNVEGKPVSGILDSVGLNVDQENLSLANSLKTIKVPSVKYAIEKCTQHHSYFPYVRYIAWDVCIDLDSEPRMIEWNAIRPGMWQAEPHVGPIWDLKSIINKT
ncbi:sugar-transfer associated ATP-grasp domain-containing protein [Rhodohalobacter barkolensis]|nr:sugar-transfer associated ATP-grasp domain-containing protein [Rhodohalobacter barkolensis]